MNPNRLPESVHPITIELTEWDQVGPAQDARLRGSSLAGDKRLRRLAETLRGRVDFREGYDGLEIASTDVRCRHVVQWRRRGELPAENAR